jgi:hypothetical protein
MKTIKYHGNVYTVENMNSTERNVGGMQHISITGVLKDGGVTQILQVSSFTYSSGESYTRYNKIILTNDMLNKFSGGDAYARESDVKATAI